MVLWRLRIRFPKRNQVNITSLIIRRGHSPQKEGLRPHFLRLQTLITLQLRKRWIKNHCRKTSKHLICKISDRLLIHVTMTKSYRIITLRDGRYVVFVRLDLRNLRLPPVIVRKWKKFKYIDNECKESKKPWLYSSDKPSLVGWKSSVTTSFTVLSNNNNVSGT